MTMELQASVDKALNGLPPLHRAIANRLLDAKGEPVLQSEFAADYLALFQGARSWSHDTVRRKVRNAIREMRMNHGMPICSGRSGYYLPTTEEQTTAYLRDLERDARAQCKSAMVTYHKMRELFRRPAQSYFMDNLGAVLDGQPGQLTQEAFRAMRIELAALRLKLARWGRPTREQQAAKRNQATGHEVATML